MPYAKLSESQKLALVRAWRASGLSQSAEVAVTMFVPQYLATRLDFTPSNASAGRLSIRSTGRVEVQLDAVFYVGR